MVHKYEFDPKHSVYLKINFHIPKRSVRFNPFATIICRKSKVIFQRAPSPSDFPLLNYFWIYFTCGFDIRDSLFGSLMTHYGPERVKETVELINHRYIISSAVTFLLGIAAHYTKSSSRCRLYSGTTLASEKYYKRNRQAMQDW